MGRFVGIRHRTKRTAEGEERPTQIFIINEDGSSSSLNLADDDSELDFVLGRHPVEYREAGEGEDLSGFLFRHIKQTKGRPNRVPSRYEGIVQGDIVAMALGGSGDRMAFALSRRGQEIGARVYRITPFLLDEYRGGKKEDDAKNIAFLAKTRLGLFSEVDVRDRALIAVREAFRARIDAMKDRIACEQRLRQQIIGRVFLNQEGKYPEGSLEDAYDAEKANDTILQALLQEEGRRERELTSALGKIEVYEKVLKLVEGCGPMIAARLIASIGDIRRFESDSKLKAFCGVHVLADGAFPRRRRNSVSNWHPEARQALYLLGEQFNRRPESLWGLKLREYKRKFREKHPEVVVVAGKKRYTDGHIHKMALWRTRTKFVEWLWREWRDLEEGRAAAEKAA